MRALLSIFAVTVALGLLAVDTSAADKGDKKKKERDPAALIKRKDKDGDGKLTLEEFTAGMEGERLTRAQGFFKRLDKDSDGKLTLEELKTARKGKKKGDK